MRLSGGDNLRRLRRVAEQTVKRDLEGIAGVAAVKVAGGEEEEIQVEVDAGRLSAVGLSLADVTQRLAEENVNLAGGSLTEGRSEYLVRAANQFATPEEIADVILAARPDGVVRLSDVATVRRGAKDRDVVARVGGDESVELAVYKEGDANTVTVARAVKRRAQRLALPAPMKMVTVADASRFIENAIGEVAGSAVLGGLLAVLVLFAFLRDLRSTMVIALAIPISVMATFVVMYRFGLSFNLMSLGGLALSVGNLVDNSIVVLESIFRKRQEGLSPFEAARRGTSSVAMAVTASTLTTIAVFLPLVFVEGLAGQLIRDQALTIAFSQVASLVVALTLVPALSAFGAAAGAAVTPAPQEAPGRSRRLLAWAIYVALFLPRLVLRLVQRGGGLAGPLVDRVLRPFDAAHSALERGYPTLARAALARPGRTLAWSGAALVASLLVATLLPTDLFPSFSQGAFHFDVQLPEGTALHVTDSTLMRVAASVQDDPRVRFVHTSVGRTDLSEFAGSAREANRGRIAVLMKDAGDAKGEEAVAAKLRAVLHEVPGLRYEFERPALFTFRFPVETEIYTYDLDTLRSVSNAVAQRMARVRGVSDVQTSVRTGEPEVRVSFDRARLAALQLDVAQASRLVRNAVQGEAATQFNDLERKLDVRVRASEDERSVVADLVNLEVGRSEGRPVLLGAVADIDVGRGPGDIRRIGQQRAAVVSANLRGRDLGSAARDIEAELAGLALPPGVRVALAGQNRELAESFGSLRFALLLAIFLVYLVMASQFESLLHPFVIMFALPMAVVGVVLALLLTGSSVNVMVLIGLIILAGIVVNNAIVLVDYANQLRSEGLAKREALVEAGRVRMRPILMTTLTTVLGLLPMAIGSGEGAELRRSLALTLMGGLSVATVLTLVVTPVIYATLDRRP
jgi:HAE1 family hydrophobic/amphiphilic exporter-1